MSPPPGSGKGHEWVTVLLLVLQIVYLGLVTYQHRTIDQALARQAVEVAAVRGVRTP